jgi:hypothetical protein
MAGRAMAGLVEAKATREAMGAQMEVAGVKA